MFMNRWLFRHEIVDLNELSAEEEWEVFGFLKPFQGVADKGQFLESDADTVIAQVRRNRPYESRTLSKGIEEDRNVIENMPDWTPNQTTKNTRGGRLMKTKEAASYLAISERQLQYEAQRGNIAVVRMGKTGIRFVKQDLDEFVDRFRTAASWAEEGGASWQV
jgi:excisionase family DNA binding protein